MGDEPDGGQSRGQTRRGQWTGQAVQKEGEGDWDQGGEQSGQSCGKAHGAHGQRAIEDSQRQRAFKAAQNGKEQIVRAGQG